MHKLADFLNYYKKASWEDFSQIYTLPILLIEKNAPTSQCESFNTLNIPADELLIVSGRKEGEHPAQISIICTLNDAQKNQSFLISIGRSPNNAIQLKSSSLSKFHAYFKKNFFGKWNIVDAGSSNGTKLNGKKLMTNKPQTLKNNDGIEFGAYLCTFFYPEAFFKYMKWLLAPQEQESGKIPQ